MKCRKCGKAISEDNAFCNYCGHATTKRDAVKVPFVAKAMASYALGKITIDMLNNTGSMKALSKNPYTDTDKHENQKKNSKV